jgi:hypothetical protein
MVRVVAVPSGAVVRELRGTGPVTTCRFSPDGSQLAVLGISQLRLYDTGTWELRTPIDKLGSVGPMPGGDVAFLDVAGSAAIVGAGRDVLRAFRPDSPNPRGGSAASPAPFRSRGTRRRAPRHRTPARRRAPRRRSRPDARAAARPATAVPAAERLLVSVR